MLRLGPDGAQTSSLDPSQKAAVHIFAPRPSYLPAQSRFFAQPRPCLRALTLFASVFCGTLTGIGPGPSLQLPPLLMVGVEAEKPSVSAQPTDQERRDTVPGSAEDYILEVKAVNLQGEEEEEVVRLAIQAPIEGQSQEVEFDFNLNHDRPKQVRFAPGTTIETHLM